MDRALPFLLLAAATAVAAPREPAKADRPAQPTTYRRTADGAVRGSDGEVIRRTPDGAVRSSEGPVARRTPDGAVRFSDGQTVRTTPDGALRTSDGVTLRRMADGSWQGSDGTHIRSQADGSVIVTPPWKGGRIDPARAAILTHPALGQDPSRTRDASREADRKPGG